MSDPLISFHFAVDIPGITSDYFTEVSGLEMKVPAVKSTTINSKGQRVLRQVPGDSIEFSDIVLKRALTPDTSLWEWRAKVEQGGIDDARCNGSVIMYTMDNKEVARWNFIKGWPSKISGPSLSADSDDVAIEELTIIHEGLERVL